MWQKSFVHFLSILMAEITSLKYLVGTAAPENPESKIATQLIVILKNKNYFHPKF